MLLLSGSYMLAEVVGGYLSNSLALMADAGHMLSDVGALALALFAVKMSSRPATPARSYGFHRTEILAALVNGATLVGISLYIFVEAFQRFRNPPDVEGGLMTGIAAGGLTINVVGLWILSAGRSGSLNERGAWLHVLTDALGSVGAILGGIAVWKFGLFWADPAVSVLIGLLVIYSSWGLLRESVAVLMEGVPGHIKLDEVREAMLKSEGVHGIHDLHVWSITSGTVCLSAHAEVAAEHSSANVLRKLKATLQQRFGVNHTTIQIEPIGFHEQPDRS